MLKSLLREPLVHFLLLGALLFALNAWLRPAPVADAGGEIVVSEGRVRNLGEGFRRTWQRPPTRSELDSLIQDYIRDEVLYREALALGLDQDDTVIRRRLRQKMEFVSDDVAALKTPSNKDLGDWLAAHPNDFRIEPRATFAQLYLDPRQHGDDPGADAQHLLDELNRSGAGGASNRGDGLLLLEPRYENVAQAEVARLFGRAFAQALFEQPIGRWVGPIDSGYGSHLVRLESKTAGGVAKLEDVRPLLERDWANAKRKELAEAFYAQLRSKYEITVKMPEGLRRANTDETTAALGGQSR
jgi:PPIC-type PPIASE domain